MTQQVYPEAFLTSNKNRLKIYHDLRISDAEILFLGGSHNFEIELFNPTRETVAAKIFINGTQISGSMVVIKPGERHYLDRYIDTPKKFLYDTYAVENTDEAKSAIADNGKIRVEFYKEKTSNNLPQYLRTATFDGRGNTYEWNGQMLGYHLNDPQTFNISCTALNSSNSTSTTANNCSFGMKSANKIETGRVQEGVGSEQNFYTYNGLFEAYSFHAVSYQILPESIRPVEIPKLRSYCPGCRTRVRKQSWKFCPSCGESLD